MGVVDLTTSVLEHEAAWTQLVTLNRICSAGTF